jgi:hypothetical protein
MAYEKACRVRVHLKGLIAETSTSNGVTSRHVQLLRALQEAAGGGAMRGVVLTRAKTGRCAVLLGAHLVAVARLTKQGRWDLTQRLSGRENETRWGLETQLACEYKCGSISAVAHPNYAPSHE